MASMILNVNATTGTRTTTTTIADAVAAAAKLNADAADDWTYTVRVTGADAAVIDATDEDGVAVGTI